MDLAYAKEKNPRVACEVLIGHGVCHIINETSCHITKKEVKAIVNRIADSKCRVDYKEVPQDVYLAGNQEKSIRCGDNGIFKGLPVTPEMKRLSRIARSIYLQYGTDGKYIIDGDELIICQSHAVANELRATYPNAQINPLGYWTGGIRVDSGATNRKLGSDMGEAVTGGGLHGKDLSKADVSLNVYAHLMAEKYHCPVRIKCAIGDEKIFVESKNGSSVIRYSEAVEIARKYIQDKGGFEKFACWGLN